MTIQNLQSPNLADAVYGPTHHTVSWIIMFFEVPSSKFVLAKGTGKKKHVEKLALSNTKILETRVGPREPVAGTSLLWSSLGSAGSQVLQRWAKVGAVKPSIPESLYVPLLTSKNSQKKLSTSWFLFRKPRMFPISVAGAKNCAFKLWPWYALMLCATSMLNHAMSAIALRRSTVWKQPHILSQLAKHGLPVNDS